MARGGIRLVHGHTKGTLITYFSGMKIDPNYAFLHAFFLICPSCPFQNMSIWPKTHPFFFNFARFAPLNAVRAYSAWSWKTTIITWTFGRAWYPLTFEWAPREMKVLGRISVKAMGAGMHGCQVTEPHPCPGGGVLSTKVYPGTCRWNGSQNQPLGITMTPYSVQKLV